MSSPDQVEASSSDSTDSTDDSWDAPWQVVPTRVLIGGVLLLAALVFLPTLAFDLVYDDHWTIVANGFLREPDLSLLWSPRGASLHVPDAFRPTLVTFDALTYRWFALSPAWHHAVSVVLHVAVCGGLAAWLSRLGTPVALRVATVGCFAVLAVHAEVVAVVSYREDLLAAAFGLWALVLAERASDGTGAHRIAAAIGSAIAMALACGAKLNAAPLVVVFVLARVLSPWRPRRLRPTILPAATLLVGIALAIAQRYAVYGALSPFVGEDPRLMLPREGMAPTLAASAQNHLEMVRQLAVPLSLSPEYPDAPAAWTDAATLLAVGALALLLAWGIGCAVKWRRPTVALAVLGTAVLLGPTSGVIAMPNLRADRFLYLPSALACIGIAAGLLALGRAWAERRGGPRWIAVAPLVAFVVLQGGFATATANAYRSDTRLWTIALRRAPHSARAHAVLGELLSGRAADQERPDPRLLARAAAHCEIARQRDDGTALPPLCDARLAAVEGDWSRAYRRFREALPRAVQGRERVLASLASVALDRPGIPFEDRAAEAEGLLERVTREYPYSSEAHAVAGRIAHRLGEPERALAHYRRARSLRPERWDLVIAVLELQVDLGHPSSARLTWELYEDGLATVDLSRRKAVRRRLGDAERIFGTP